MNDLSSDSTYLRELNRALYDPDKYESMMASRAQLRLGHSAMQMQTACSALLNSQSNWQVWEAVDALAEYEPRRDWTIKLLEKATRHPNGLVRAKAEMALER